MAPDGDQPYATGDRGPTPRQALLLRAALLEGTDALRAWEDWTARTDIDDVDPVSYRLLPLLYRNLESLGVTHPVMNRLKGTYRRTWYHNRLVFRRLAEALAAFDAAGIVTLVLGDAALAALYYRDYGLRLVDSLEVLVRREQAPAALEALHGLGWTSDATAPDFRRFVDPDRRQLVLRWRMPSRGLADADVEAWSAGVPAAIEEIATRALSPADELLRVCAGAAPGGACPAQALADAMAILRASAVDWRRVVDRARAGRVGLPLTAALSELRRLHTAPIPADVLAELRAQPVTLADRLDYRAGAGSPDRRDPSLTLWACYRDYLDSGERRRAVESGDWLGRLTALPRFLKHRWGVDRVWKVPYHAAVRAVRSTRRPPR